MHILDYIEPKKKKKNNNGPAFGNIGIGVLDMNAPPPRREEQRYVFNNPVAQAAVPAQQPQLNVAVAQAMPQAKKEKKPKSCRVCGERHGKQSLVYFCSKCKTNICVNRICPNGEGGYGHRRKDNGGHPYVCGPLLPIFALQQSEVTLRFSH